MEKVVESVTGRHHEKPRSAPDGAAEQEFSIPTQEPTPNGTAEKIEKTEGEKASGEKSES